MVLSIDFDGTVVEHDFPNIGRPLMGAFETLIAMQAAGHKLILWTCREDHPTKIDKAYLTHAVEFCRTNGLEFDAVNAAIPEEDFREIGHRRKPHCQIYIDDRNLNGFPGWAFVWRHVLKTEPPFTQ